MYNSNDELDPHSDSGVLSFEYHGENGKFFEIYLKNMLMTLFTLGIYSFWARVQNNQYVYRNLQFQGRSFDFNATGKELFVGFLKGIAIVGAAILCFALISSALNGLFGQLVGGIILVVAMLPVYFLAIPFLMHGKMRFRLARTSWSNIRFRFDGQYKELAILFAKSALLMIVTLGFYAPVYFNNLQKYFTNHSTLGHARFEYQGKSMDLFWIYFKGMLLSVVTLGLYYPWFLANATRYVMDNTKFEGKSFSCDLTGGQMFGLIFGNLLIMVCTLGFGMPIAINRSMRLFFGSIVLHSDESVLQGLLSQVDLEASALAGGLEQAAEALDAVAGIL
jgi:uncharacterized membrane protein YjgN (DUF898 family)